MSRVPIPTRPWAATMPQGRWHLLAAGCALAALLVGTPGPAAGQDLADVCRPLEHPTVGRWALYRLRGGTGDSSEVRLAIVGSERVGDVTYLWQESRMGTPSGDAVIQTLVPADPYDPTLIRRAIVRMPGREPQEVPAGALAAFRHAGGGAGGMDACRAGAAIGWETVETPAGPVRALRVRYTRDGRAAESWLAPGIPFALVRTVVGQDPLELILVGHGRNAVPTVPLREPDDR